MIISKGQIYELLLSLVFFPFWFQKEQNILRLQKMHSHLISSVFWLTQNIFQFDL